MGVKKKCIIFGLSLIGAALVTAAAVTAYDFYYDSKCGNYAGGFDFYVMPGQSPEALADSLVSTGKVLRPRSLVRSFRREELPDSLSPGHYAVETSSSGVYTARMVKLGWQTPVSMTLSTPIRSKGALARKISSSMLVDSAAVAAALSDMSFLAGYGVDSTSLFTLVIPDTYSMYWTASVKEIFDRLKSARDEFWSTERRSKADALGMTPEQVSILASIVDGESHYAPELPVIAGVYLNRLRTGMKLQADPTIAYIYGYTLNRILRKHLAAESPYNTYKYAGLPPGPISIPPKNCIEAVLDPTAHDYYYFCANPAFNGSHIFASTYGEHLKNARAFQHALTERQRARQRERS